MELYRKIRLACRHEGLSEREAARVFGVDRRTVSKILAHSVPPGYRRSAPPKRPKLDPFTEIIDGILEEDLNRPKKQRHTAKRIRERLRDEHGFDGCETIVKDYVRSKRRSKNTPLRRPDCPAAGGVKIRHWIAFHRVSGRLEDVLSGDLSKDPTCLSS